MTNEETNIDDLLGSFVLESTDDISENEAALLDEYVEDPEINNIKDDKDPKKQLPKTPEKIIPDGEDDFLKKMGENPLEKEEDDDDEPNTDIADDSHDGDKGDDTDASTYFKVVAEGLNKLGKFSGDEIPESFDQDSFLDFYEKFTENKVLSGIEEKISDKWGDEGIKIFNDIFVAGVDPREYFASYNNVLNLQEIDLEKESNQKLIVSKYLEALGQDEDEILDQIEVLEDKGRLAERAFKYKEKLVEDEKREIARKAAEKESTEAENKKAQAARYSAIKEAAVKAFESKEINGIPLNTADSKELLPFATDLNWKLANGTLITDADKAILEIKRDPVKWLALSKLLKEGLNVTPIKSKGAEEKADDVFNFRVKKTVNKQSQKTPLDIFLKKTKF